MPEFPTPDRLATLVSTDLHNWLFEKHLPATLAGKPPLYESRFKNFFIEYLGTSTRVVPFGGRTKDLDVLDAWLDTPASPPYLLLTADAGRGKSALLTHWSCRLLARNDLSVVHLPVSIRHGTNLDSVIFMALAARLAEMRGEDSPGDSNTSSEIWSGLVADFLRRPLPEGRRLVVILDGLDEAEGWRPGIKLFPLNPPSNLRLIVSARHTAEMPDAAAWRRRLGWEDPALAHTVHVEPLDRAGLADVLTRMGHPLDELGRRADVVTELLRLTGGDPILVRLYVEDLRGRGGAASLLGPEDLQSIQPGLAGYFEKWWEDQRDLWGDRAPLRENSVQSLLGILTCAFGPLTRQDLLAVAPPESNLNSWTLDLALESLARFLIGDGRQRGYVFGHPKFALYLVEALIVDRQAWDGHFLGWGQRVLADLESHRLDADKVPAYLVQYLGAHLERAGAPLKDLLALVSENWKSAWVALEGSYSGFVGDIDRAWRKAAAIDRCAVNEGQPAPHLAEEIYLGLCRASIVSLETRIPPALLERLVEQGVWKPTHAFAYARRMPNIAQRSEALGLVSRHLAADQRAQANEEALTAAMSISSPDRRAWALMALLSTVDPPPVPQLKEALSSRSGMRDDDLMYAARSLIRRGEIDAAIEIASEIPEWRRGEVIKAAAIFQFERQEIAAAFRLLRLLPYEYDRVWAAQEFAPRLVDLGRVEEGLPLALEVSDYSQRPIFNSALVHAAALGDLPAMRWLATFANEPSLLGRFLAVASDLALRPESLRLTAGDSTWIAELVRPLKFYGGRGEDARSVLLALRPYVDANLLASIRAEIIDPGKDSPDPTALARFALLLSGEARDLLASEMLAAARSAKNSFEGDSILEEILAGPFSSALLAEVLEFVDGEQEAPARHVARALAAAGQESELSSLLVRLKSSYLRERILVDLHGRLPEDSWSRLVRPMLSSLSADPLGEISLHLDDLIRLLSGHLLRETVVLWSRIGDLVPRACAHAALGLLSTGDDPDVEVERLIEEVRLSSRSEDRWMLILILLFTSPATRRRLTSALLEFASGAEQGSDVGEALHFVSDHLPSPEGAMFRQKAWELMFRDSTPEINLIAAAQGEWPLPNSLCEKLSPSAFAEAAIRIQSTEERLQALSWLLDLLPSDEREFRALMLVHGVVREAQGELGAIRLALRHLPREALQALIAESLQEPKPERVSVAITVLAPHMNKEDLLDAHRIARALADPTLRTPALAGLLPYLPAELQRGILREVETLESWVSWAVLLAGQDTKILLKDQRQAIIQALSREMTPAQFELLARASEGEVRGSLMLRELVSAAVALDRPTLCRVIQHVLRPSRSCDRSTLLLDVTGLAPVLLSLGGEGAIAGIKSAIQKACTMFP